MRICDLLGQIHGKFIIKIYKEENKLFKECSLKYIKERYTENFNVFNGFGNVLWETPIKSWSIYNNVVEILI